MIRVCLTLALVIVTFCHTSASEYQIGYDDGYTIGFDDGRLIGTQRGTELGSADGYAEGFDVGWENTYWPSYNSAYEISQPRGYRDGWIESYQTSFAAGADAISEWFGSWEAGVLAVSRSVTIYAEGTLTNLSAAGTVDGLDFISWTNSKFTHATYQQGYTAGLDVGFAEGDEFGFDQAYGPAYEAAYGPALAEGESEGAHEGPIDGQRDGYEDGTSAGQTAGEEFGRLDVVDYFLAGESLSEWQGNQQQFAAAAFGRQHPEIVAQVNNTMDLTEATNLMPTTVGLVTVVPEPSTALLMCGMVMLAVVRRRNRVT